MNIQEDLGGKPFAASLKLNEEIIDYQKDDKKYRSDTKKV